MARASVRSRARARAREGASGRAKGVDETFGSTLHCAEDILTHNLPLTAMPSGEEAANRKLSPIKFVSFPVCKCDCKLRRSHLCTLCLLTAVSLGEMCPFDPVQLK